MARKDRHSLFGGGVRLTRNGVARARTEDERDRSDREKRTATSFFLNPLGRGSATGERIASARDRRDRLICEGFDPGSE